jgi:hypothetical protein
MELILLKKISAAKGDSFLPQNDSSTIRASIQWMFESEDGWYVFWV